MFESKNINDYIAKAVVLRDEFEKIDDLKEKFGKFTLLFPTFEDKMICKAVFDLMFTHELKMQKFINQMINGINGVVPHKMTEMMEVYNQAVVLVDKKIKENNKKAASNGGERFTEEEKQGSHIDDDRHGRQDNFVAANMQDPNRQFRGGEILVEKGNTKVSIISQEELNNAKKENSSLEQIKKDEIREREEEEKRRAAYQKTLDARKNKKQYGNVASSLQRVYDSHNT